MVGQCGQEEIRCQRLESWVYTKRFKIPHKIASQAAMTCVDIIQSFPPITVFVLPVGCDKQIVRSQTKYPPPSPTLSPPAQPTRANMHICHGTVQNFIADCFIFPVVVSQLGSCNRSSGAKPCDIPLVWLVVCSAMTIIKPQEQYQRVETWTNGRLIKFV